MPATDELKQLEQLTEAQKEKLIILGLESAIRQFGSLDFLTKPGVESKLQNLDDQHLKKYVVQNAQELKRCVKDSPLDASQRIKVELQAIQNKPSSSWRRGDIERYYDRFEEPEFLNSYLNPEQKLSILKFGKRVYSIIYPRWWGGQGRASDPEMPLKPNQIYPEASFYRQIKPVYQNHLDAQQVADSLNHFDANEGQKDTYLTDFDISAKIGNHRSQIPVTKASLMQKYFPKVEKPEILPPAGISTLEMRSIERARSQPKQKRQYAVIEVDVQNREKPQGAKVVYKEKEVKKISQTSPVQISTVISSSTQNTKKRQLRNQGEISMQPTSVPGFGLNQAFAQKSVERHLQKSKAGVRQKKNKNKKSKKVPALYKSKNTTLGENPLRSLNLRNAQSKIKSLVDEDKTRLRIQRKHNEDFEKYGSDEEAENIDYLTSELDRHQYYNQEAGGDYQENLNGYQGRYNIKMSNATSDVGEDDRRFRSGSKQESNFDSGNQSVVEQPPHRAEFKIQEASRRERAVARVAGISDAQNDALEDGQKVSPSENLNSEDNIFQYSRTLDRERGSKRESHPLNILDEYRAGRSGANPNAESRNAEIANINSINYSKELEQSHQNSGEEPYPKDSFQSQSAFEIASRLLNSKIIAHLNYNQERQDFDDQDQLTDGTGEEEEQYARATPVQNSKDDIPNVQESSFNANKVSRMSNLKPGNTLSGQEFYKQSDISDGTRLNSQSQAKYHKKQSSHDPSTISGKKNLEQRKKRDMIYNNYTKGQFVSETGVVPIEFGSDEKLGNETSSSFSSFNANDDMKSFFRKEFVNKGGKLVPSDKKGQGEIGNNSVVSSQISYSYGPSKKDYNKRKEILN